MISYLPNALTLLRLWLIPVLVVLIGYGGTRQMYWAAAVFLLASLSDFFDGFFARRYGLVSELGKLMDPVADKILVMSVLVMLVAVRREPFGESTVPAWMVVMILAREIWITAMRAFAAVRGRVMSAGFTGKIKSVLQMVAILLLLLGNISFSLMGLEVTLWHIGLRVLLLSIVLAYWSAYQYSKEVFTDAS